MTEAVTNVPFRLAKETKAALSRDLGLLLLIAILLFGFGFPLMSEVNPAHQDLSHGLAPPGGDHPLGTDHLGRDLMARLAAAIRLSVGLAVASVATAVIPGVFLGVVAGWRGGWLDGALGFLADTFLALPGLLLVVLMIAILPDSYLSIYVGFALVLWVEYFRVARAMTRTLVASPQVEAAGLLGFGPIHVFRRHLWPVLSPQIMTIAAFGAATAILSIAALGFVSIGLRPPTAELGLMMTELLPYYDEAPWALAQPILVVFLLVLSLNMMTGGARR
jgi:peptide/nickel transport system permease protein